MKDTNEDEVIYRNIKIKKEINNDGKCLYISVI
jgi:hypothetical protein